MSYESIGKIAHEIGTSRQNLSKMLKRHSEEAPQPNSEGKYDLEEVRAFYHHRTYKSTVCEDLKAKILEQQYRLKKIKADEAEGLVIAKSMVVDLLMDADITLESVMKMFIEECSKDKAEQARLLERAKIHFNRWREFLKTLT